MKYVTAKNDIATDAAGGAVVIGGHTPDTEKACEAAGDGRVASNLKRGKTAENITVQTDQLYEKAWLKEDNLFNEMLIFWRNITDKNELEESKTRGLKSEKNEKIN